MQESRRLNLILDFCLRVGDELLAAGAGAADVTATMLSLAHKLGVGPVEVDVTFTALRMVHQDDPEVAPLVASRLVQQRRVIDYQDLTLVDHLVRAVLNDEVSLDEARAELRRITSTGHARPDWAVTLGWGVMCGGVAVMLGGGWLVIVLAFVSAIAIDLLQTAIARRRIPTFYQQVAGGGVGTMIAVAAAATPLDVDVSLVITANIVMLLAGIGYMGALQDALSGFYLTAGARLTEATLATAGIIGGVSGGLGLANLLGVELPNIDPGRAGFQQAGLLALGSALAGAAFAYSSYSPKRTLVPIAVIASVALGISQSIEAPGIGRAWSVALAAFFVGLVAYAVAGRLKVPPLVIVVSAVVPLLPGISVIRGLALLAEGTTSQTSPGLVSMITAVSVALAIASGVILGEYVAQPLKREARRVESRLAGPRLIGPVKVFRRRHRPPRAVRRGRADRPQA